jgi:hypothetical protein
MSTNSLNPHQQRAYQEIQRWSDKRQARAHDLAMVFLRIGAGRMIHKDAAAARAGIGRAQFSGVLRDARVMACVGTGLAPQIAITHWGQGYYSVAQDAAAVERWLRTNARYVASRSATMLNVVTSFSESHPGDLDAGVVRRCEQLESSARRLSDDLG